MHLSYGVISDCTEGEISRDTSVVQKLQKLAGAAMMPDNVRGAADTFAESRLAVAHQVIGEECFSIVREVMEVAVNVGHVLPGGSSETRDEVWLAHATPMLDISVRGGGARDARMCRFSLHVLSIKSRSTFLEGS